MGAEQSALLASTETSASEAALPVPNAELFFHTVHFESMPKPKRGPVTDALLCLVNSKQNKRENPKPNQHEILDNKREQMSATPMVIEFRNGGDVNNSYSEASSSCCSSSCSTGCSSVSIVENDASYWPVLRIEYVGPDSDRPAVAVKFKN